MCCGVGASPGEEDALEAAEAQPGSSPYPHGWASRAAVLRSSTRPRLPSFAEEAAVSGDTSDGPGGRPPEQQVPNAPQQLARGLEAISPFAASAFPEGEVLDEDGAGPRVVLRSGAVVPGSTRSLSFTQRRELSAAGLANAGSRGLGVLLEGEGRSHMSSRVTSRSSSIGDSLAALGATPTPAPSAASTQFYSARSNDSTASGR